VLTVGLSLRPINSNRADDGLSALVHMHMLNPHELRAATPEPP
jgi:hypothetical protein